MDYKINKMLEKEKKIEERLKEFKIKKSLDYFDIKRKHENKSMINSNL